jgi:hypothetical protein
VNWPSATSGQLSPLVPPSYSGRRFARRFIGYEICGFGRGGPAMRIGSIMEFELRFGGMLGLKRLSSGFESRLWGSGRD